ncbi:MAG: tRNA (adenosine(37)-N6)-dimethylallyltransferase MiaA [Candidatus Vogelbacteria bacterium]|nr:tRNA (adenosine(37)-N6)-dimethylallyltransferase MiaA [Candidatus Vogelbacteria bacterium]
MKAKIIAIVGPTASGKSALAVRLARKFDGEIISADSRQVYKGLDIGSGKITKKEMRGIRHHLLDVASPKQTFTAARYKKLAGKAINGIARRVKLPIFCGGTGFYLDAVLGRINIPPVPPNPTLRIRLEKLSTEQLFEKLQGLDVDRAKNIDRHNRRRLVRAIEVAKMLNTRCLTKCSTPSVPPKAEDYPLHCLKIRILIEKDKLRQNIHRRLSKRLKQGLISEVRQLHQAAKLSWRRLDNLGLEYRYVARYLRGQLNKEQMTRELETASWHYAKRQITWWKRDRTIRWVKNYQEAERLARDFLQK